MSKADKNIRRHSLLQPLIQEKSNKQGTVCQGFNLITDRVRL